ncbi:S-methyl-5-thioribose-1-phosphate isomerase, partial [bacterium]
MNEPIRPIYWDSEDDCLVILDQRKLPENVVWLRIKSLDELEDAII